MDPCLYIFKMSRVERRRSFRVKADDPGRKQTIFQGQRRRVLVQNKRSSVKADDLEGLKQTIHLTRLVTHRDSLWIMVTHHGPCWFIMTHGDSSLFMVRVISKIDHSYDWTCLIMTPWDLWWLITTYCDSWWLQNLEGWKQTILTLTLVSLLP